MNGVSGVNGLFGLFGKDSSVEFFRKGYLALGLLAAGGLIGYGLAYIVVMPQVSPDGFVPKTTGAEGGGFGFGALLATFILVYAFAFLPVNLLFTVKHYRTNPYALVLAGSLIGISLVIEILNNLPLVAAGLYLGKLEAIPPEVLLYLRQAEAIRYLAYDVAGFSIAYAALLIYAMVYFRSQRWLSYTILGSIGAFIANVPCLWFAPQAAVVLMSVSIFLFAAVPVFQARMVIEMEAGNLRTA